MHLIKCPHCKEEIPEDNNYCDYCGGLVLLPTKPSARSVRTSSFKIGLQAKNGYQSLNKSSQLFRLNIATLIISLSILPLFGMSWLLIKYPGLMETPTIYPEGLPVTLILVGIGLVWLLCPLSWFVADRLIDLSKLHCPGSGSGWLVLLVGFIHYCVSIVTFIFVGFIFSGSFSAQTSHGSIIVITCCVFPAGVASAAWVAIGYPISFLRILMH